MINKRILKWILLAVGVFVVSAGAVITLLLVFAKTPDTAKNSDNNGQSTFLPDTSKDFGACNLVDKSLIKQSLGDVATNLQGPDNMGLIYSGNFVPSNEAQKCVYPFKAGGTMDNSFNADDGFSIEVYNYSTKDGYEAARDFYGKKQTVESTNNVAEMVSDMGEVAFYEAKSGVNPDGTSSEPDDAASLNTYLLIVFEGQSHYAFNLSQPAADSTFDYEKALTALKTIASGVDFARL